MSLGLKKVWRKVWLGVLPRHGKAVHEDIQLVQSARGGPATNPTVNALELKLAEEEAKRKRLEHEHQRAKAEADAFVQLKRKLEDELLEVKEFLETREKDMSEMQKEVGRVESGTGPIADIFCAIPHEACRVASSS